MKWAFLISGIVELLGGIIICLYPAVVFSGVLHIAFNLYGIAAIVLGIFNFLLFRFFEESKVFRLFGITMMFFHGAVAMMVYKAPLEMMPQALPATLTHLGLFVAFVLGYLSDVKPDHITA